MDAFGNLVSRYKFGYLGLIELLCEISSWKNSWIFKVCVCVYSLTFSTKVLLTPCWKHLQSFNPNSGGNNCGPKG